MDPVRFFDLSTPIPFLVIIFCLCLVILALVREISRTKQKRVLYESEHRFHQLVDNAPVQIWMSDRLNQCTYVNKRCLEYSGRDFSSELGSGWMELIHPEDRERCQRVLEEAAKHQKEFSMEFRVRHSDGKYRWLLEWGIPKYDLRGNFDGFIGSSLDIHVRKTVEQRWIESQLDLKRAKESAEVANETKSRFVAAVSHELRTPLTAIMGYADLLAGETQHDHNLQKWSHTIQRNARLLLSLVNDVLDLSKIEADSLDLHGKSEDIGKIVDETVMVLMPQIADKGLHLHLTKKFPRDLKIVTDSVRVQQILINLLGNAIKFTEKGDIFLTVDCRDEQIVFEVRDTGTGIRRRDQDAIFQPFVQLGTKASRSSGAGLGLYLSRRLARAMGGDISLAETFEGQGSTFHFTLPRFGPLQQIGPAEDPSRTQSKTSRPLEGLDLLVVEDGVDIRTLWSQTLKSAGADVELAEDGISGVLRASKKEYDLILMDLQMPGINGYEATSRLREGGYAGPILAISASLLCDEAEKCRLAGCDGFVPKPIEGSRLVEKVAQYATH